MCSPQTTCVKTLLEEHEWAPRTTHSGPDWGKLTASDMVECGLSEDHAELPSVWNKMCAAAKPKRAVPYTDANDDDKAAWAGRRTFWTDGSSDKTNQAGFGVIEGKWGYGQYARGVYFRTPGKQTVNRSEIAAILWSLKEGRGSPIVVVSDSENALRACAGYTIKGSEDLCEALHLEMGSRRHAATFIKVVSHPLEKKKQTNWAHWGNDFADKLATLGKDLPSTESWKTWSKHDSQPAPRTLMGKKYFHKAEQACEKIYDFAPTDLSVVREEFGRKGTTRLPKNSIARFMSCFAMAERNE